ncbi:hypothetical protein C8R46DRAFT_1215341 [Mycena filopes]|nr:hypothetical protein C8R46DRAFT_1215341 [Mycena filopes]
MDSPAPSAIELLCRDQPDNFTFEDLRVLVERDNALDTMVDASETLKAALAKFLRHPQGPRLPAVVIDAMNDKFQRTMQTLQDLVNEESSSDDSDKENEPPSEMAESPSETEELEELTYRTTDDADDWPDSGMARCTPHPYPCELADNTRGLFRAVVFNRSGRPAFHGMWLVPTEKHILPQHYPLPPGSASWREFQVYTAEGSYRPVGDAVNLAGRNPVVLLRHRALSRGVCPGIEFWEEFSQAATDQLSDEDDMTL